MNVKLIYINTFRASIHVDEKKFCRNYRQSRVETPSHPGGISREARNRQEEKRQRDRDRGLHISSKDKRRDDRRDRGKFLYHLSK